MAYIKKINDYDIKDAEARESITSLETEVEKKVNKEYVDGLITENKFVDESELNTVLSEIFGE